MKHIRLYEGNELDPFEEEDWNEVEQDVDYLSIYISYFSIIVSENLIKRKTDAYTYLDSATEKDIPYKSEDLLEKGTPKKEIYIDDQESSEWLIKVNNRKEISNYKDFIEKCINDNLEKYFGDKSKGLKFEINGNFYVYPLDIEIIGDKFPNYINKYFFKK